MVLVTVLGNVISKLAQLLKEEYHLQAGLRDQIKTLTRDLEHMHAVLRKVAEVPPEELPELDKLWARDIGDLSYDMEDILDTILVRVDGRAARDPNTLKRAAKKISKLFSKIWVRHQIADMIKRVNQQADEVEKRRLRYLIVLDDIWETSTWKSIKIAFIEECSGSRIITTTRKSKVSMEIGAVYNIAKLSDQNSKELFWERAFRGEQKHPYSAALDEVCDKILQKCDGVPLAIVTIASVLARKPQEEWSSMYNSIGFGRGDRQFDKDQFDNMKKILSFSYYDLPYHLRICFLYIIIFIEGSDVETSDLVLRWIAEGFVKEENGREVVEIGDSYLHELIDRSMIMPIMDKGTGLLSACRVHDMLLSLISDLSTEENFVVVLNGEKQPPPQENIRRLALQMLKVETNYKDMPQVRSFNAIICHTSLMPPVSSFKVLRVLALEFCIEMEDYPLDHIAKLLHLRYLRLSHTPARKLPKDIGRLKFLQTLILKDTGIEELPVSAQQLTQLMCLRVDRKMSVPEWIGELTSLVELEMYHGVLDSIKEPFSVVGPEMYRGVSNKCSAGQFAKALGKLTNLRVLKTGINLEEEGQGKEFLESLRNLHNIHSIDISLPSAFLPMDVASMEPSFALSSTLCVLDLFNIQFSRLPAWINDHDLPKLCQLSVVVSVEVEQDLLVLGKFRGLRNLTLAAVKSNGRLKLAACGSDSFKKLISLRVNVPLKFAQGTMPRLESIHFSIPVANLKDAGIRLEFGLENLLSLRSVHVNIDCGNASLTEVDEAEAVLKGEVDSNPNRPALEVTRGDEDKMGPDNAESRMQNRQFYEILKASTLSDDIKLQQDLYDSLYNEAAEVARSLPKEHPCVAKLVLLPQELAGDPVRSVGHAFHLSASNVLIENIKAQERLLEEYNIEIPRIATILEELKNTLRLQAEDDDGERASPASAANSEHWRNNAEATSSAGYRRPRLELMGEEDINKQALVPFNQADKCIIAAGSQIGSLMSSDIGMVCTQPDSQQSLNDMGGDMEMASMQLDNLQNQDAIQIPTLSAVTTPRAQKGSQ